MCERVSGFTELTGSAIAVSVPFLCPLALPVPLDFCPQPSVYFISEGLDVPNAGPMRFLFIYLLIKCLLV